MNFPMYPMILVVIKIVMMVLNIYIALILEKPIIIKSSNIIMLYLKETNTCNILIVSILVDALAFYVKNSGLDREDLDARLSSDIY